MSRWSLSWPFGHSGAGGESRRDSIPHLLSFIRDIGVPVITFAVAGSAGESILLRSYSGAGFTVRPLGVYPKIRVSASQKNLTGGSEGSELASPERLAEFLANAVSNCSSDTGILWSDPAPGHIRHYLQDPRPRVLLASESAGTGLAQAAWAIRLDIQTSASGDTVKTDTVTTIDTVWLPRTECVEPIRAFASQAGAWDAYTG